MTTATEALRDRYNDYVTELQTLNESVNSRVLAGGEGMSSEERSRSDEIQRLAAETREQYEASMSLDNSTLIVGGDEARIQEEINQVTERAQEASESNRAIAASLGSEFRQRWEEREAAQMGNFEQMSGPTGRSVKLTFNMEAARNLAELRGMGMSPQDFVGAVRGGEIPIVARNSQGERDVRLYTMDSSSMGPLVPDYWDESLYRFASYIGGVMNAGAEVVPQGNINTVKWPRISSYADALVIATEGSDIETQTKAGTTDLMHPETQDGVETFETTPRPIRGYSGETDELTRSAPVYTRFMILLRGLARALTLAKESYWHNGTGSGQPKGIMNGIPSARTYETDDGQTARQPPRYDAIPQLLSMLDAEYHSDMRPGSLSSLMHSAFFYRYFVGAMDAEGRGLYPHLMMGDSRNLFGTRTVFSHLLEQGLTDNAYPIVTGNFYDAYLIATHGGQEVEVSDDTRFLQWETVYRIQEYCDGNIRDNRALSYLRLTDS